ncbi:hypothetical protein [Rasiella sp. SM2506]|uniref:hypothetical protein n=1 Tax=Rasiella sp. SM2506 TaxID=3423914 RepID=UPI003D7B39D3
MELTIYTRRPIEADAINNFKNFYYSSQMKFLASELLNKGLSPNQISEAVQMAVAIANASKIDTSKHFMPVYSALNREIIKDCKLSQLGYGLVLMNANTNLSVVGDFQILVLKEFFNVNY